MCCKVRRLRTVVPRKCGPTFAMRVRGGLDVGRAPPAKPVTAKGKKTTSATCQVEHRKHDGSHQRIHIYMTVVEMCT